MPSIGQDLRSSRCDSGVGISEVHRTVFDDVWWNLDFSVDVFFAVAHFCNSKDLLDTLQVEGEKEKTAF